MRLWKTSCNKHGRFASMLCRATNTFISSLILPLSCEAQSQYILFFDKSCKVLNTALYRRKGPAESNAFVARIHLKFEFALRTCLLHRVFHAFTHLNRSGRQLWLSPACRSRPTCPNDAFQHRRRIGVQTGRELGSPCGKFASRSNHS